MEELVKYEGGKALTTSRKVAEKFGKRHDQVLRDIRNTVSQLSENQSKHNFVESDYVDSTGKRNSEFIITRDGFTLIAMGFTGKKAMSFKFDFISQPTLYNWRYRCYKRVS